MNADDFAVLRANLVGTLLAGFNAWGRADDAVIEVAFNQADRILENCGIVHPDDQTVTA